MRKQKGLLDQNIEREFGTRKCNQHKNCEIIGGIHWKK
jgi:hypothetical protein